MGGDLVAVESDGVGFGGPVDGDVGVGGHADVDDVAFATEGFDGEVVEMEPGEEAEVPRVGDLGSVDVSAKDAVGAGSVEELMVTFEGVVGA